MRSYYTVKYGLCATNASINNTDASQVSQYTNSYAFGALPIEGIGSLVSIIIVIQIVIASI